MKVLLIAGHGAGDPGACAVIGTDTYFEARETRTMVTILTAALKGCGVDVTVYPTSRNAFTDYCQGRLSAQVDFSKYDFVLEVHFNALRLNAADGKTKGVECHITHAEENLAAAEAICAAIASVGFTNRGVKRNNWAVISKAKAAGTPAVLLEVCFIDDPDDIAIYVNNREEIAERTAKAIAESFGLQKPAQEQPAAWAADAWQAAKTCGVLDGTRPADPVTRQELAAVLQRVGLLEQPLK